MKLPAYVLPNGVELIFDGPMLSVRFGPDKQAGMLVNDGSAGLLVLAKIIEEEGLRMRRLGL